MIDEVIYIYAVRYAMGRRTTAPDTVIEALLKKGVLQSFITWYLERLMKDILAAINKNEVDDPAEQANWMNLADAIESELMRRKFNEDKNNLCKQQ